MVATSCSKLTTQRDVNVVSSILNKAQTQSEILKKLRTQCILYGNYCALYALTDNKHKTIQEFLKFFWSLYYCAKRNFHTEDVLYYDVTKNVKHQTRDNYVVIYSKNDMCHRCIAKFGNGTGEDKFLKKAFPNKYIVFISLKKYPPAVTINTVEDQNYMTFVVGDNKRTEDYPNKNNPKYITNTTPCYQYGNPIPYLCFIRITKWSNKKDTLEITFDDSSHLVTKVEFKKSVDNIEKTHNNSTPHK